MKHMVKRGKDLQGGNWALPSIGWVTFNKLINLSELVYKTIKRG